jgi:hypothetical protein
MAKIHVVYNGHNDDLTFEQVFPQERFAGIGIPEGTVPSTATLTSDQVKTALAQHYDVGLGEFADHYVEMNPNGNITVRPNTTFGGR